MWHDLLAASCLVFGPCAPWWSSCACYVTGSAAASCLVSGPCALCWSSCACCVTGSASSFLFGVWAMCSMVIFMCFTCNLNAILFIPSYESRVDTACQVLEHRLVRTKTFVKVFYLNFHIQCKGLAVWDTEAPSSLWNSSSLTCHIDVQTSVYTPFSVEASLARDSTRECLRNTFLNSYTRDEVSWATNKMTFLNSYTVSTNS